MQKKTFLASISLICINGVIAPSYAQPSPSATQPSLAREINISRQQQDQTFSVLAAAFLAASSALLLPLSKEVISRLEKGSSKLETEKINEIVQLVNAESERETSALIRTIVEQSPANTNNQISEIREMLRGIRVEAAEVNKPIQSAIEGLVRNYHSQALSQSGIQFYFSVLAATIGFSLIIYSGVNAINSENPKKLLNTLPGVVISGVSALFFKQAEETRKRATDLYDRLRSDERQSQAIAIANGIESLEFRSRVQAQLALHLADVKDAMPIDLSSQVSQLIARAD